MITTANIQVYPMTPFAFKPTDREEFIQNLSVKAKRMTRNKDVRQRQKRQLLCQLFNVQIKGGDLTNICIKEAIEYVLSQMQVGNDKCEALQQFLNLKGI